MKTRTTFSKDWSKYQEIIFSTTAGGVFPSHQLAKSFLVSRRLLDIDAVEVEPLTFSRFVRAVVINFSAINYWRLIRMLWKLGFIKTKEGNQFCWKDLTLKFWEKRGDEQ